MRRRMHKVLVIGVTIIEELDKAITLEEVELVIRSLKRNKSFSRDQLLNEYFIDSLTSLMLS